MDDELPKSTHSGELTIMGVELRVHRLDNGQTVFEADGFHRLLEAMASGAPMSEDEAMKLAKVIRTA